MIDGIPIESLITMLADNRERLAREYKREPTPRGGFYLVPVEKKHDAEESKAGPVRPARRRRS